MSTADERDSRNLRHFFTRSDGKRAYAPSVPRAPGSALCDCVVDPATGQPYCLCSAITTTDMAFAPDHMRNIVHPSVRFASPCERAMIKRRQMAISKATA